MTKEENPFTTKQLRGHKSESHKSMYKNIEVLRERERERERETEREREKERERQRSVNMCS